VLHRPLVFVSGLTVGDYLLWSWSSSGNHTVLGLVSGLTLPPLAAACVWLLTLGLARLIGRTARPSDRAHRRRISHEREQARRTTAAVTDSESEETLGSPASSSDAASRTLAA